MDHEIDGFEIHWTCELCGTPNTDDFNLTLFPMCEGKGCGEAFDWSEILDQSEINTLLAELSPGRYQHLLEISN